MAQTLANKASAHYATIDALTPKDNISAVQASTTQSFLQSQLYPYLPYVPFILVFLLLFVALALQMNRRVSNAKQNFLTMFIAFIIGLAVISSSFQKDQQSMVKAGPDEIPRNVQIQKVSSTSVRVTWHTDAVKTGALRIGKAPLIEDSSSLVIADTGHLVKDHTGNVDDLQIGNVYEIEILSGTSWYTYNDKPIIFSFK